MNEFNPCDQCINSMHCSHSEEEQAKCRVCFCPECGKLMGTAKAPNGKMIDYCYNCKEI